MNEISPHGSGSPPVDNIDSGGSSVYVSANDASPQIDKDKNSGQTSFETASSGSRFSSPPEDTEQNKESNEEKDFDYINANFEFSENVCLIFISCDYQVVQLKWRQFDHAAISELLI